MVYLTKAQRKAVKRIFDRAPIFRNRADDTPISYKEFRKTVQPTFGLDNCVMVYWAGMWLGIETDGYTHS